jgi:uncharacterized membrane protein
MSGATPIDTVGATQDERTMAVLAHALQLVGGWIAPLVIFFVKRQSRFVSFHALQVLFLQLNLRGCLGMPDGLMTIDKSSMMLTRK